MRAAGVGGIGGLARGKSFFQKTLEAPGGAFPASLGCVGGGGGYRPPWEWRMAARGGSWPDLGSGGGVGWLGERERV